MVSQFVSSHEVRLLGELDFPFPEGTHAIGRLDNHSEGLLILTTDKKVTRLLFQDKTPHKRTYLVKVRYKVQPDSLEQLRTGLSIQVRGGGYYTTAPCGIDIVEDPRPLLTHAGLTEDGWEQDTTHEPPATEERQLQRKTAGENHTWLLITLTEGKFHQVRKMVGALNHRCLRLIRLSIEDLQLAGLPAGQVREIAEDEFFLSLKIAR